MPYKLSINTKFRDNKYLDLIFEHSLKDRYSFDRNVIRNLKDSLNNFKQTIKNF